MNALYIINYLIFSVFLTMFMVEIGLAVITLLNYNKYKEGINRLIKPIWEVTGTFAVFYLVNFEVSYPTILSIVGNAYAVPLLIAAIFIILRNIFIIFSEYIGDDKQERRFRLVYVISTLIAAVLAIAVLSSGISGIGLNITEATLTSSFLINPFTIIMLLSLLLLSLSLATAILKPEGFLKIGVASEVLGFILAYVAIGIFLPGFSLSSHIIPVALSVILLAIAIILQTRKSVLSGKFNMIFILIVVNLFGISAYPYIFGTANITNYIAASALAGPEIIITLVGGALVALSLAALVYINYIKK